MGFNWLFVNPIHLPGFSGSLYAIKEYDLLNPAFLPEGTHDQRLDVLRPTLQRIAQCGLAPMVDLVLNHTASRFLLSCGASRLVYAGCSGKG